MPTKTLPISEPIIEAAIESGGGDAESIVSVSINPKVLIGVGIFALCGGITLGFYLAKGPSRYPVEADVPTAETPVTQADATEEL